jgi:hypothetical protein
MILEKAHGSIVKKPNLSFFCKFLLRNIIKIKLDH